MFIKIKFNIFKVRIDNITVTVESIIKLLKYLNLIINTK